MNTKRPLALIQIHYHNRVGGVTTVMRAYARAFAQCNGILPEGNLVLCHSFPESTGGARGFRTIDMPSCDYHRFSSRENFDPVRKEIVSDLSELIDNCVHRARVAVIGHNMTLGKNCALSSAFYQCADSAKQRGLDVSFFSVVHDFAEEGRSDMMQRIAQVETFYPQIRHELYAPPDLVRFVSPSRRNVALLRRAGRAAAYLPNPVAAAECEEGAFVREVGFAGKSKTTEQRSAQTDHASPDVQEVTGALEAEANRQNVPFDPARPTMFYPGRIIARKNIAEAILVGCCVGRVNLLLGAPGTSGSDRAWAGKLQSLCQRHRLPVIFDAPSGLQHAFGHVSARECFSILYRYTNSCLSTSVAEGFGYALYEPWCYGKLLVGRFPQGANRYRCMDWSGFYSCLPVPVAWVNIPKLAGIYRQALKNFTGKDNPGLRGRWEHFWGSQRKTIDFGMLDSSTQAEILELVARQDTPEAQEWTRRAGKLVPLQANRDDQIARNRKEIIRLLNFVSFQSSFCNFFFSTTRKNTAIAGNDGAADTISTYFTDPRRFRCILTPENV